MSVLLSAEGLTIITSVVVFLIIILILVVVILVAKSKLLPSGDVKIVINDDKELEVPAGGTLLNTLQQEKVYLSSAILSILSSVIIGLIIISCGIRIMQTPPPLFLPHL